MLPLAEVFFPIPQVNVQVEFPNVLLRLWCPWQLRPDLFAIFVHKGACWLCSGVQHVSYLQQKDLRALSKREWRWPLSWGRGKLLDFKEKSWSTVACGASFLIDYVFRHEPGAGAFDLLEEIHSLTKTISTSCRKRSMDSAEFAPSCNRGAARCPHTGTSRLFRCQSWRPFQDYPYCMSSPSLPRNIQIMPSVKVGGPFKTTVTEL